MRLIAMATLTSIAAAGAYAQPPAVSPDLSPEAAGAIFQKAVIEACVPAVTRGGVSALPETQRGTLRPTNNPETRQQAGAAPDETVWDVMDARGVVTVRERAGRCVVSVYGPPATGTILSVAQGLTGQPGFQRLAGAQSQGGLTQTLSAPSDGKSVMVQLRGADPGAPGHESRFSVVTATVFLAQ